MTDCDPDPAYADPQILQQVHAHVRKKLLYRKVHFLKSNQLNCNTQDSKIVDSYVFVADPIGENLQLSHRSPYWVRTEERKGKNGKGEKGKGKVVLPPYLTHFNHLLSYYPNWKQNRDRMK